jgi:hypothetical protein
MPLSWNDIRNNALAFSKEWANEASESAEAKTFWDEFLKYLESAEGGLRLLKNM